MHIGDDLFHPLLVAALEKITPFQHTAIIGYPDNSRPTHIYNDLPAEQIAPSLERYFKGAYLLDPLYNACQAHLEEGCYRLRQLAPDEFYESEYYRTYYEATRLTEEIGILVEVSSDLRVMLSLGVRDPEITVSASDFTALDIIRPLVTALCRLQWKELNPQVGSSYELSTQQYLREPLDLAFHNFGRDHLSERECEIVRLVLKGHSSKSIANLLHISSDTVKAHRKHIHSKLQISSQAELFSLFLDAISTVHLGNMEDPLSVYYATLD